MAIPGLSVRALRAIGICSLIVVTLMHPRAGIAAMGSTAGVVTKSATAGAYKLVLTIGPMEQMLTPSQAKEMHARSGEVMVGGSMEMGGMGAAMPNHHLEVHVYSRSTGKTLSNAMVAISIATPAGKVLLHVPVAMMYGIKEGMADFHYGNNVALKPGHYHVLVQVDKTSAVFDVTLGQSQMTM
jgi:hypothetical protein